MTTLMPFPPAAETPKDPAALHDMIAGRAREIWTELGQPEGQDLEIWLEAEAEIQATLHHTLRHPHLPPNP